MVSVIVNAIIKISKMTLVGFMLFILLIASPSSVAYQDPEIKPFVSEFIRLGKMFKIEDIEARTKRIKIKFGKIDKRELANCSYYLQQVVINSRYWKKLSIENKEEVVFHELGHCVLNIKTHTDTGIMKPAGLHLPEVYREDYEYLINDLFDKRSYVQLEWDSNKYGSSKEYKLTKAELLNNEHAVARFTAKWCPPCKALAPVFDEVAKENPAVKVYVVDVDENPDLATDMGVRGIPCMVEIRNNKVDTVLVGNQPKTEIEKLFK